MVTKSALVGIIHDKTIHLPRAAHDDGEAVTLMTTDTEGLDGVPEMFHETWAQALEVVIGLILLSREVGWIWPLPLVLIFRESLESPILHIHMIHSMLANVRGFCSMLSHEPLCGQTLTSLPDGLECCNPAPCSSNKHRSQFREGDQDVGTPALHGQPNTPTPRRGVVNSIKGQVDHGILQCQRSVSVLNPLYSTLA